MVIKEKKGEQLLMKKYVKPEVFYEGFEMSMGVASCTDIVFNKDGSLKYYDEDDAGNAALVEGGVFGGGCEIPLTKDNFYNYYGEQPDGFTIFGS